MESIHPLLRSDEQLVLQRMRSGIDGYSTAVEKILSGIGRGEVNDPWRANQLMEPSKADIRAADSALAQIGESIDKRVLVAVSELADLQNQAAMLMASVSIIVLMIALGFDTWFPDASPFLLSLQWTRSSVSARVEVPSNS